MHSLYACLLKTATVFYNFLGIGQIRTDGRPCSRRYGPLPNFYTEVAKADSTNLHASASRKDQMCVEGGLLYQTELQNLKNCIFKELPFDGLLLFYVNFTYSATDTDIKKPRGL